MSRAEGRLIQQSPPGVALSAPSRTKLKLTPHDFRGMWPARFVPDYYMNRAEGGVDHYLTPDDYPLTIGAAVGAGTITSTLFDISNKFDEYNIQSVCVAEAIVNGVIQPPTRALRIDCLRRDLGAQDQVDDDFVSLFSVFGSGRYPHQNAMPLVLSSDTSFQIELRNREPTQVRVWLIIGAIRKDSTRETIR